MQQMEFSQDLLSMKTYREHSVPTKERTSGESSKSSSESLSRQPRCLRWIKGDGLMPTSSWVIDGALRIEFLMHNIGESPNVGVDSTLSQILEATVPEKYYLSVKACEGILRRANRRGKKLPEMLQLALEQQIERMS